jgi:hypothetical protein
VYAGPAAEASAVPSPRMNRPPMKTLNVLQEPWTAVPISTMRQSYEDADLSSKAVCQQSAEWEGSNLSKTVDDEDNPSGRAYQKSLLVLKMQPSAVQLTSSTKTK